MLPAFEVKVNMPRESGRGVPARHPKCIYDIKMISFQNIAGKRKPLTSIVVTWTGEKAMRAVEVRS